MTKKITRTEASKTELLKTDKWKSETSKIETSKTEESKAERTKERKTIWVGRKLWGGQSGSCGFHCIKMKHIGVKVGSEEILSDVNLHIHCGSLTAIIGRNGAGKSTLLKAILGEIPHEGEIVFTDLRSAGWDRETADKEMAEEETEPIREKGQRIQQLKIGYVPQSLSVDKNTPVSVYDLLAGYLTRVPVFLKKSRKVEKQIREQLSVFQAEALLEKSVCDLSGGELQRVLLALATIPPPNLLILDEPAAGIDQKGIAMLYEILNRIKVDYDMAVILVSHDLEYVRKYADQVVLLDRTVLAKGSARQVLESEAYAEVFGTRKFGTGTEKA